MWPVHAPDPLGADRPWAQRPPRPAGPAAAPDGPEKALWPAPFGLALHALEAHDARGAPGGSHHRAVGHGGRRCNLRRNRNSKVRQVAQLSGTGVADFSTLVPISSTHFFALPDSLVIPHVDIYIRGLGACKARQASIISSCWYSWNLVGS